MDISGALEQAIVENMAEGVVTIDAHGCILTVNRAAADIFRKSREELEGQKFASCFFEYEENDAFNQAVLDAVYDRNSVKEQLIPYYTGKNTIQLRMITSLLMRDGKRIGLIAVFSDISELTELRDAVQASLRIQALNQKLQLRNELLSRTFGRYLSDEIVNQLIDTEGGLRLGGEKKFLTVMMSDLRGFTAMSEQMPADQLLTMLNHYLGEMTDIIQKHKGTIIEFIGDGIMAVYGAPQPVPDHAAQAVAAGIEMQARMEAVNTWNKAHGFPVLEMGIGINTGYVIVGNIGSEKRTKYGVTGSSVNLCGRIEGYTIGGQVLIADTTRERISEDLEIADSFSVTPKGKSEPMTIFSVTGIGAPYDLHISVKEDAMQPLRKPFPVTFSPVIGKDISEKSCAAEFTALGECGARIRTAETLRKFDNIVLDAGGKLYAKVMEVQGDVFRIHFTSCPEGFPAWVKKLFP